MRDWLCDIAAGTDAKMLAFSSEPVSVSTDGTRASTIIALDAKGHGFITERRFDAEGHCTGETRLPVAPPTAAT